ncbi:hypothetical protein FJ987_21340 [Mesorhizobium sp. CU2]|uniref:hypothetical protein n=1 Tax=unclassified Mesorhizobium TaxID=325217 RepID=UPI00112604CD|nr:MULTISPECIES: hypothetical protein [unclassified Mesorhizobium]TPN85605.1 hypothetical protein FJ988_08590 [Mesorhizobium sp. CU3]TPO10283.1 hypothetical protein FJ987_21340 [Mesorhizobium sp. CU2]
MDIDYRHLLVGAAPSLRYGPATASRIDALLLRAEGCVISRQRGRAFADVNVDGVSHRVEFDREADLEQFVSGVRSRGIPLHRDREVVLAVLGIGAVLVLTIALALWLRP